MAVISKDQIAEFRASTPNVMNLRLQELEVTQYFGVIFCERAIPTMTKQDMTGFLTGQSHLNSPHLSDVVF